MSGRTFTLTVEKSLPHERLDSFLRLQLPAISRSSLQRLIEEGYVTVNAKRVKPTYAPRAGDHVSVVFPEARPARAGPENIPLDVLYEDQDIVVLNKPSGLVVHPAAGHEEHTLVNALLHHCQGSLSGIGGVLRPGIVHRLDKDTSGCLVVAKHDSAHLALSAQFSERSMTKIYLAVLCGVLIRNTGEIRAAIARHPNHRKRMAVTEGIGREAWTSYQVLERLHGTSFVKATLHTGRTHQIRVHFQHLGFPLLGDETYGKRQTKRVTEMTGYAPPRLMLHASQITFRHPQSGEEMSVEAPLPKEFCDALAALRRNNVAS